LEIEKLRSYNLNCNEYFYTDGAVISDGGTSSSSPKKESRSDFLGRILYRAQDDDKMAASGCCCCHLRVVLFCSGTGGDPVQFRPNRDETPWWGRRDSLTRCVAAFLMLTQHPPQPQHGHHPAAEAAAAAAPATASTTATTTAAAAACSRCDSSDSGGCSNNSNSRELVLLFDQDWARMTITYCKGNGSNGGRGQKTTSLPPPFDEREPVPTERTIVALLKTAARNPGTSVRDRGFTCRMELPVAGTTVLPSSHSRTAARIHADSDESRFSHGYNSSSSNAPSLCSSSSSSAVRSSNKRDILEYLQGRCSMEFLRRHRLNSTLANLVRKSNRERLLEIVREWDSSTIRPSSAGSSGSSSSSRNNAIRCQEEIQANGEDSKRHLDEPTSKRQKTATASTTARGGSDSRGDVVLKSILTDLVQPRPLSIHSNVVVATLHESSNNELPCWDEDWMDAFVSGTSSIIDTKSNSNNNNPPNSSLQLFLFLGAVRDMLPTELKILERVCWNRTSNNNHEGGGSSHGRCPLQRIRLGPVPEFSSKILTVTAFHHLCGRLFPAVQRLDGRRPHPQQRLGLCKTDDTSPLASVPLLHFVCLVPVRSDRVTTDPDRRDRILWCLVRCTVAALWRSRVGSGSHTGTVRNRLTLLFEDGAMLSLEQDELVRSMSERHQVAPSEHQVLSVLRMKLQERRVEETVRGDSSYCEKLLKLEELLPSCVIEFNFDRSAKTQPVRRICIVVVLLLLLSRTVLFSHQYEPCVQGCCVVECAPSICHGDPDDGGRWRNCSGIQQCGQYNSYSAAPRQTQAATTYSMGAVHPVHPRFSPLEFVLSRSGGGHHHAAATFAVSATALRSAFLQRWIPTTMIRTYGA
jgi:Basic tilted helix bundle domain